MEKQLSKRAANKIAREKYAVERAARYAEVSKIVQTGKCPDCGGQLKRNLSLTGWWQCEQLGAVGFRKDPNAPSCGFQVFTEH